jgi:hypothetical protein
MLAIILAAVLGAAVGALTTASLRWGDPPSRSSRRASGVTIARYTVDVHGACRNRCRLVHSAQCASWSPVRRAVRFASRALTPTGPSPLSERASRACPRTSPPCHWRTRGSSSLSRTMAVPATDMHGPGLAVAWTWLSIWLVPSNQLSNFHHGQPWTLVDNGGHHARGQVCDGPGSVGLYLASGRRGHQYCRIEP